MDTKKLNSGRRPYKTVQSTPGSSFEESIFRARYPLLTIKRFPEIYKDTDVPKPGQVSYSVLREVFGLVLLPRVLEARLTFVRGNEQSTKGLLAAICQTLRILSLLEKPSKFVLPNDAAANASSDPEASASAAGHADPATVSEEPRVSDSSSGSLGAEMEASNLFPGSETVDVALCKRRKAIGDRQWRTKVIVEVKRNIIDEVWKTIGQWQLLHYLVATELTQLRDYGPNSKHKPILGFGTDYRHFDLMGVVVTGGLEIDEDGEVVKRLGECSGWDDDEVKRQVTTALSTVKRNVSDNKINKLFAGLHPFGTCYTYMDSASPFLFLPFDLVDYGSKTPLDLRPSAQFLVGLEALIVGCVGKVAHEWRPGEEGDIAKKLRYWNEIQESASTRAAQQMQEEGLWSETCLKWVLREG